MAKHIIINIVIAILMFVGLNTIYTLFLHPNDLKLKSDKAIELNKISNEDNEVIYISDCSNTNTIESDSIKTSVLQNLNLFYPVVKMTSVDHAASHAGVFISWLKYLNFMKNKPRCLIVTMNLRSFNASWINSNLESALQESLVLMRPYPNLVNRFALSLKAYDYKTESERDQEVQKKWRREKLNFPYKTKYNCVKEWDSLMANGTYLKSDGSWDFDKISLACHYIKAFAFTISEDNPRIKDYDEITKWAKENEIKLFLNLIPENVEFADSLVNKDLLFLMRRNAEYLQKRYNSKNCVVLNNMELLSGENFTEKNWTTEHYNYKGRMFIAKSIAQNLKSEFKNKYKKAY